MTLKHLQPQNSNQLKKLLLLLEQLHKFYFIMGKTFKDRKNNDFEENQKLKKEIKKKRKNNKQQISEYEN